MGEVLLHQFLQMLTKGQPAATGHLLSSQPEVPVHRDLDTVSLQEFVRLSHEGNMRHPSRWRHQIRVGAGRLERPASRSQTGRSNQLSYAPDAENKVVRAAWLEQADLLDVNEAL